jgi:cobalt-zinc-cadmium efflux system membrane fusion protein
VFNAVAAEKRLRLKGAEPGVVEALRKLVPKTGGVKPCQCDDPNCKEGKLPSVSETLGKDDRFAWYALRAPFDGTLIEKHIVVGEQIDESSELFTIADLSSVWVNLAVSQETISLVKVGYPVTVHLPDGVKADAKAEYVAAVVDPDSRTALARTTLTNKDGIFRPGTFVDVSVHIPTSETTVTVPKASVQFVHDHPCVFVWTKSAFEMREVTTGYADEKNIEIHKGLNEGELVASVNAFHLKAEVSKTGSGPSCSHGHAH